jgi:hypothetical protein
MARGTVSFRHLDVSPPTVRLGRLTDRSSLTLALYRKRPGRKAAVGRRDLALSMEAFEGMLQETQRYGI